MCFKDSILLTRQPLKEGLGAKDGRLRPEA